MTKLYNTIYVNTKKNNVVFQNPEEALAFFLKGAAKHMALAAQAARDGRIEDRSNSSDHAMMIFASVINLFEQGSDEEQKEAQPITNFLYFMNELIVRMNIKNDLDLADVIVQELHKAADLWAEKAAKVDAVSKKNDNEVPLGDSPQEDSAPDYTTHLKETTA